MEIQSKPWPLPGLHSESRYWLGLPDDEYHADPAPEPSFTASLAKRMIHDCPAAVLEAHPRLGHHHPSEASARLEFGKAAHAYILEGKADQIYVIDAADYRKDKTKQERDEARAAGKIPLLTAEYGKLQGMYAAFCAAILESPEMGIIDLPKGNTEVSIVWRDPNSPAWLRGRIDWLSEDRTIIVDYKTTANANPYQFAKSISQWSYDLQVAWYTAAVQAAWGTDPDFIFIAQEIEWPYRVSFNRLDGAYYTLAEQRMATAIRKWNQCLRTGKWPGYQGLNMIAAPAWLARQMSEYVVTEEEDAE